MASLNHDKLSELGLKAYVALCPMIHGTCHVRTQVSSLELRFANAGCKSLSLKEIM